jgi:hypothetical protein
LPTVSGESVLLSTCAEPDIALNVPDVIYVVGVIDSLPVPDRVNSPSRPNTVLCEA